MSNFKSQKEKGKNPAKAAKAANLSSIQLTEGQKKEIQDTIVQTGGPLDPVQNVSGVIDYDSFERVHRVITLNTIRFMQETTNKNKLERRALLKAGNLPEYNKMCQKFTKARTDMREVVTSETVKLFSTSKENYQKASAYYQKNPVQAKKLGDVTKECQVQVRFSGPNAEVDPEHAPLLTKEQTMSLINRLEEAKVDSTVKAQLAITLNKLKQEHHIAYMNMAQMKAYDQIFFDTGADEEDINRAM